MKMNVNKNDIRTDRQLSDLISVGKATLSDFHVLGIHSVNSLSKCDAHDLFAKLCKITDLKHDPCVEDVFSAAIAQAQNPDLPFEKCQWWYWSKLRKRLNEKK